MKETNKAFDVLETLTVREAAALLHISRPTLVKYIKAGELPSVQIGRCRRIRRTALEAFLDRHTTYGWQKHRPEPTSTTEPPMEYLGEGEGIPF